MRESFFLIEMAVNRGMLRSLKLSEVVSLG